jgi:hypothetical protein
MSTKDVSNNVGREREIVPIKGAKMGLKHSKCVQF